MPETYVILLTSVTIRNSIKKLKVMLVVFLSSDKYVSTGNVSHQTRQVILKFINFYLLEDPQEE